MFFSAPVFPRLAPKIAMVAAITIIPVAYSISMDLKHSRSFNCQVGPPVIEKVPPHQNYSSYRYPGYIASDFVKDWFTKNLNYTTEYSDSIDLSDFTPEASIQLKHYLQASQAANSRRSPVLITDQHNYTWFTPTNLENPEQPITSVTISVFLTGLDSANPYSHQQFVFKIKEVNGNCLVVGFTTGADSDASRYKELMTLPEGKARPVKPEAVKLFVQGRKNLYSANPNYKLNHFAKATKVDPKFGLAYFNSAIMRINQKDKQGALKDFDRSIKLLPNFVDNYMERAFYLAREGDCKAALASAQKAIEVDPHFSGSWEARGAVKKALKDYSGALKDFNKSLELGPTVASCYARRAAVYSLINKHDQAINDLNLAINAKYENRYFYQRAKEYFKIENYYLAKGDLETILYTDPGHEAANELLAKTLEKQGNLDEALNRYSHLIEFSPNNANAYYYRGEVKRILGHYQDAIKDFKKSNILQSNHFNTHFKMSLALNDISQHWLALKELDKAIRLDSKAAGAFNNRGWTKAKLYDYKGCIEDSTKALELNPKEAYAYNNRGLAKWALHDRAGAIADFNKSIELDPKNPEVYKNFGKTKLDDNKYKEAVNYFNKALELNGNDKETFHLRGKAKTGLGDKDGAYKDFHASIIIDPDYKPALAQIKKMDVDSPF